MSTRYNEEHCIWRAPAQNAGEMTNGSAGDLQIQSVELSRVVNYGD
jgi:hypothetical protein